MATFRKVHTSFWSDPFTSELESELKLFYLYLITNERTKQCGIYEITKRQIAFDLKCSIDTVSIHLKYFISKGKIRYNEHTNEIAIKNWLKYNDSTSPKVKTCIDKELQSIKDRVLIEYIYSIDTQSQKEKEEEEEKEEENNAANAASSPQVIETPKKPKPEVAGYAECIAVYDNWLKARTGVGVKMDGMQGKAMKEIIKYLDSQKLNKEQPVEEVWEFILNSWDKLSDYHKNKLKLSEINSDLINILNQIKNGKQKSTNQDAVNFAISLLRDV